jgi:hypothetical protein
MVHMYPVVPPGSLRMESHPESPKGRPEEIKPDGRTPYTSKVPEDTPSIRDDPPALEISERGATAFGCHLWPDAFIY